MKKTFALILAVVMCLGVSACVSNQGAGNDPAANGNLSAGSSSQKNDVTVNVMLMPQGEMNEATVAKVTDAVNARLAELGYDFKVTFSFSGGAWGFDRLDTAIQTGAANLDIIPAHSWSGAVTYTIGAMEGQYLRLDNPADNLLEKYGPDLYGNTAPAVKAAATVNGIEGVGIYGYIIEKDSVSQLGFLVNKTALEELGFTLDDFDANDFTSWTPILNAYKEAYPNSYPLNAEAEVLDRTVNHVAFTAVTTGPLGVVFNNADPAGASSGIVSRYETQKYQDYLQVVRGYYEAGFIHPDQGVPGEISSNNISSRRTSGDFLISSFVYAPGAENPISASASEAQGKDIEIVWVPGWSAPIATAESALGSGLAIYAGTKNPAEAVIFLNLLASDTVIGNLLSEGVEGESFEIKDGIAWRLEGRAGWNIWRYGVVGANSGATPLGDVNPDGNEWVDFKTFNNNAVALDTASFLFDVTPVDNQHSATRLVIDKWAVPLGSGAANPADYASFIAELKGANVDEVVAEAERQFAASK